MKQYNLDYFIKKEEQGTIFAKVSKSCKSNDSHGTDFPYHEYINDVINPSTVPGFVDSTIEPLEIAFGYFHYGDSITIVNFTELKKHISESSFEAWDGIKSNCYQVNSLYVVDVKSLNDPETIDYLLRKIDRHIINEQSQIAISSMRKWGCDVGADYLEKMLTDEDDVIISNTFLSKLKAFFKRENTSF